VTLNALALESIVDSDWLLMFLLFMRWKNRSKSDSSNILPTVILLTAILIKLE